MLKAFCPCKFQKYDHEAQKDVNSKDPVPWKVEKAMCHFVQTDKVTMDNSTSLGKVT